MHHDQDLFSKIPPVNATVQLSAAITLIGGSTELKSGLPDIESELLSTLKGWT